MNQCILNAFRSGSFIINTVNDCVFGVVAKKKLQPRQQTDVSPCNTFINQTHGRKPTNEGHSLLLVVIVRSHINGYDRGCKQALKQAQLLGGGGVKVYNLTWSVPLCDLLHRRQKLLSGISGTSEELGTNDLKERQSFE